MRSNVKKYSLLNDIVKSLDKDHFVGKNIYKYEDFFYFILSRIGSSGLKNKDDFYIVSILWAVSDGAAKRAIFMCIEEDDNSQASPPAGFIVNLFDFRYGYIKKWVDSECCNVLESAFYRMQDGAFVSRKIETEKYVFYFRDNCSSNIEDVAYAILKKL